MARDVVRALCTEHGPAFKKINIMKKDLLDFFKVSRVRWRKNGEVGGRRWAGEGLRALGIGRIGDWVGGREGGGLGFLSVVSLSSLFFLIL